MKSHYRAVVIGGGVVGASVLYHLARAGWTDIALIERAELTAGSTWHAAAGFHALNANPAVAALQAYTIRLYPELERESGQAIGLHPTGGLNLAGSARRWEWLQAEWALFQSLDMDARLVGPEEIAALCPIVDPAGLHGGLYDPAEGHLDPHGTTHAFAAAARQRGAEVILHTCVTALTPTSDGWRLTTDRGEVVAQHVVNAAGLWARRVGRMAGVDLPLTPMQHHYLITEDVPELARLTAEMPAVTDLDGFTYLRQERRGVLLGVYERNPAHWHPEGAPWDFGMDLIPPEVDRILPELAIGFERFPALAQVGIRRWVNGALTFTPDGNPLVGPVPGLRGMWAACGCMAGFSQGGAIGHVLANWMVEGDPGHDVLGMDVARFGDFAANDAYLRATTAQFYARRFVMSYPNEVLPAGRPVATSPSHDALAAQGARFAPVWGMEVPLYFAADPGFVEEPSLRRSAAHALVGAEVAAVRGAAGLFDLSAMARWQVSGPGAAAWLDRLLACELPQVGRVRLAPMLSPRGRMMGLFTLARLAADRFHLVGAYALQAWHGRWFADHLPPSGVQLANLSDGWTGFAVAGPRAREILAALTPDALPPHFGLAALPVGFAKAWAAGISLTGEQGWEITVPASRQRALHADLTQAGRDYGLRPCGLRALDVLRLEKGHGVWGAEYGPALDPLTAGLGRHLARDKPGFIGRDAVLRMVAPTERLVLLQIDATDADAVGFEPVWQGDRRVGLITSGGWGHHVGRSLALAYVQGDPRDLAVHVVGERRAARVLDAPPYDPAGTRLCG